MGENLGEKREGGREGGREGRREGRREMDDPWKSSGAGSLSADIR